MMTWMKVKRMGGLRKYFRDWVDRTYYELGMKGREKQNNKCCS